MVKTYDKNSSAAVQGATVRVDDHTGTTDAAGTAKFFGLAAGVVLRVAITHPSYEDFGQDIAISTGTTTFTFSLTPKPVAAAPAPEGSLLSWIWAGIVSWVRDLIASAIAGIQRVVNNVYNAFNTFVTNTYNYITQAIQNIYNTFSTYVSNTYNYITQAITNVYNTFATYVSNTYQYVTQNITNVTQNLITAVTNVVGVTQEWVMNYFTQVLPAAVEKLPPSVFSGVFGLLSMGFMQGIVTSFWRGLDEGLKE